MTVPISSQAAAEYVNLLGRSASLTLQSATQRVTRFANDNPVWIAVGIVVLLLLIWWTRPRAR